MNKMGMAFTMVLSAVAAICSEAKPLVVFADIRESEPADSFGFASNAAVKAGCDFAVRKGKNSEWESGELCKDADVLVFTGGMNDYSGILSTQKGRLMLTRFLASGKGVFLTGFRSGPVRTGVRPLCPDIAATYGAHALTPWFSPVGDSPIAKAFGGETLFTAYFDVFGLKLGPDATPFAKCGDLTVGAFGPFGLGRAVVLGAFVSIKGEEVRFPDKVEAVFVEIFKYLSSAPAADDDARARAVASEELKFFRREATYDWTQDERGPWRRQGNLPKARDNVMLPIESRQFLMEHYARTLDDKTLAAESRNMAADAKAVVDEMRKVCDDAVAEAKGIIDAARVRKGADGCGLNDAVLHEKLTAVTNKFASLAAKCDLEALDAFAAKCRAKAREERAARVAAEHKRDLASLPSLVISLSSPDSEVRLSAATELGRIGEATPEVVAALVKAMDDADGKVRIQVAISLGWMQAKDAVDALVAKTKQTEDARLRRRAVQVLGQIGDEGAIPAILPFLESSDHWLRENAVLALGWLKAKEAVPTLVKYAKGEGNSITILNLRECAIRSLGMIGDASALPALKEIAAANKPVKYNTIGSYEGRGLGLLSRDAIDEIGCGGLAERGVRQPPELSSREFFYALSKGDNLLAGRLRWTYENTAVFKDAKNRRLLLPYLLDAGFTGFHEAWGVSGSFKEDDYVDFLKEADELGLICVEPAPSGMFAEITDLMKGTQDWIFSRVGDNPLYQGCWSEEAWPGCGTSGVDLEAWLKERYGDDYARKMNLAEGQSPLSFKIWNPMSGSVRVDGKPHRLVAGEGLSTSEEKFCDPGRYTPGANSGALRVAALEKIGEDMQERLVEIQDWLRARRKAFNFTYSTSNGNQQAVVGGQKAMQQIGIPGPESYQAGGIGNVWLIEKFRNGEARPIMAEFYNNYSKSLAHDLVGFYENAIHGKCFYPFDISHLNPFYSYYLTWGWDKGRWERLRRVYGHVRDHKELYEVSPSAAKVAVVVSERSFVASRRQGNIQVAQPESLDQRGCAVFAALQQSHICCDVFDIDLAEPKKLSKYSVMFLSDIKMLTDREQRVLKEWVANGGTLVCDGATSLFSARDMKPLRNYEIADLLGVRHVRTDFLEGHPVWAIRPENVRRPFPLKMSFDNPWDFQCAIYRDLKDEGAICAAKGADGEVEYDAALGVCRLELRGAKAVQTFKDGSPALTVNRYGRGRAYLFAPLAPSLGYIASDYESSVNKLDFYPGVRETYERLAREGMALAGKAQPVDAVGFPLDVEMVVYEQKGRLVVHLLDRSETGRAVTGASLRINGDRPIKAVYRPGGAKLAIADRMVALGTISVYNMLVVELE